MEARVLPRTVKQIADSVAGSVHAERDTVVTGCAQYDSRLPAPEGPFVAFPGQHVDGHDSASRAVAGGAAAVLAVVVGDVPAASGRVGDRLAHSLGLRSPAQRLMVDGAMHDHANAIRMGK
jgi:UDP-N-acetylmuramyl pentapeptide synthase